jgi:flagellum-specific ATP synthase
VLSRQLAEQGIFPAIDVGKSLSRVMSDIVTPDHARAAANLKRLWSAYEENRDLVLMGAYRDGGDPQLDEAIARRSEILDFVRQGQKERFDYTSSVLQLEASFSA